MADNTPVITALESAETSINDSLTRIENLLDQMLADAERAAEARRVRDALAERRSILHDCLRIIRGGKR